MKPRWAPSARVKPMATDFAFASGLMICYEAAGKTTLLRAKGVGEKAEHICELTPQLINGLAQIQDIRGKMEEVLNHLRGTGGPTTIHSDSQAATCICQALNMLGWKDKP